MADSTLIGINKYRPKFGLDGGATKEKRSKICWLQRSTIQINTLEHDWLRHHIKKARAIWLAAKFMSLIHPNSKPQGLQTYWIDMYKQTGEIT